MFEINEFPIDCKAPEEKTLGEKPYIDPTSIIQKSKIGSWTDIGPNCVIAETIFGDYSYAHTDVTVIYSEIGKFCSIASHVRINPGNHPMDRVMQHHCTYRKKQYGFDTVDDEAFFEWRRSNKCIIGNDVWIGHAALIMPGVRIGDGAVIGAGAVVTKNVEPYEIVAGVPAKHIRYRFEAHIAKELMRIKWWEWDRKTLEQRFGDFADMDQFLRKYCGGLHD